MKLFLICAGLLAIATAAPAEQSPNDVLAVLENVRR